MALIGWPHSVIIDADGGCVQYTLTNCGMTELAYKIKSSNNKDYRFKPVFGFAKSGQKVNLEITRTKGPPKNDRFVVVYGAVPETKPEIKDPQVACKKMTVLEELTVGLHALR
ncbi:MSP domain protein [Oesophagostomum dentatum]|uniref:MSP domain protein n=1 Tax=Oesophagostomum dentatum TaxID=61180 RepID=A0A0B1TTZ9_OESDE|nr:MSP domain protein [Oesophagostomum dentatum]